MAILRGFPPSNTIQVDGPQRLECDLCGKDFWQSFPLQLSLDLSDEINYGIMPCHECWFEDQGSKYWSGEPNKWGDQHSIYSKVREGYSLEDIQKAQKPYVKRVRVVCESDLYLKEINFVLNTPRRNPWYEYETWYKNGRCISVLPKSFIVKANPTVCEKLKLLDYRIITNSKFTFENVDLMPEKFFYIFEDAT